MSGTARFTLEESGALARIVVDGGKGNVFDRPLIAALSQSLREAAATPTARAVVIEGAGDHWSFGASVEDHRPAKMRPFLAEFHALIRQLMTLDLPRIAVVRGQCLGGGLEIALACQRIVASPSARLGQPEIKLAVFAPVASLLLPSRVGQPVADDLLLTGRSIAADEALRLRLVDEVAADPLEAARAWVRTSLAPLSASSLRFAARAAATLTRHDFLARLDEIERLYVDELMATPDAVEGIAAFLERRPARWAAATLSGATS
ncbi:MAG: cyclohexa-1,5-dienecarbonyl-CoA hydratase [Planctomycetes bacterium]|nr:cyclohexa-1,5-dienecarbonyl-CoA hydratase [Planctomycetota bacterium]